MTSTLLPLQLNDSTVSKDLNHGGINSGDQTVNPHFYNANQVYLWYCSSDNYAGNRKINGYYFAGHIIVKALIDHLLNVQSPSLKTAKLVLLTGFSAGGFGVLNNADYVASLIANASPGIIFKAFVDSGWLADFPGYNSTAGPRNLIQQAFKYFYLQLDQSCVAALPYSQQWRCSFADYVLPFITTPIFVAGYQYDSPFVDVYPPFNNQTGTYAATSRNNYLMQTSDLPFLFAPNCYCHGVQAYDARWNGIKIDGVTASESVWNFLAGTVSSSRSVDSCETVDCNPTCTCVY